MFNPGGSTFGSGGLLQRFGATPPPQRPVDIPPTQAGLGHGLVPQKPVDLTPLQIHQLQTRGERPVDEGFGGELHPAVAGLLGAVLQHLMNNAKRGGVQDFNGPLTFHPTPHHAYSLLPVGHHGPAAY